MALVVTCPCGQTVSAQTEDEFVRLVQKHAKEVHNQTVTRAEALAPTRQQ